MPLTTVTLTTPPPCQSRAEGTTSVAPRTRASNTPQVAAKASVDARIATAAPGHAVARAEHHDQREQDEGLDAVGDDPETRTPDRRRKRLGPAEHQLDRRRDEDDPGGVDGGEVLVGEEDLDQPRHRPEKDRDRDERDHARPEHVAGDASQDVGAGARAPSRASAR